MNVLVDSNLNLFINTLDKNNTMMMSADDDSPVL